MSKIGSAGPVEYGNFMEYLLAVRDRGIAPSLKGYQFYTKPYDHQARSFEWARMLPTCGLLLDMGLGKTKVTIDCACYRFETLRIRRVLVVCPLSVVNSWVEEINTHCKPAYRSMCVLVGPKNKRITELKKSGNSAYWIITNDDGAKTLETQLKSYTKEDCEIVKDESITIKNKDTQRYKALERLSRKTRYRKILSGAIVSNNLQDVWSQFFFLDRGETLGENFWAFRNRYFHQINMGSFNLWQPKRGAEAEIKSRIYRTCIRYTKAQCLDLPEKIFLLRSIAMAPNQAKAYKEMADNLVAEVKNEITSASVIITKLLRLSQITAGFIQPDESVRPMSINEPKRDPKNNEILSILQQTDDQLVIWCRFQHEIRTLTRFLNDNDYKTECIYGLVKQADRAQHINDWRDGGIRILVCQVGTAGMGITLLPRIERGITVIYRSNDYSLNNRLQSQDRTHRIGLKTPVTYLDLVCPGTIDETIMKILTSKKSLADAVTERSIEDIVKGQ